MTSFSGYPLIDIDGTRIQFGDGWGLVRASNAQSIQVMRFQAKDDNSLKRIRELVEGRLRKLL